MSVFDFLNPLANLTPRFTEEQLEEIIQWFDNHAKPLLTINDAPEPTNVVTIEHLITFLELKKFHRRHFNYPTYLEIMTQAEKLHAGVTRMLTKDQFIYMLNLWVVEAELKHELELAFRVFDTEERHFMPVEEIKEILMSYGDDPFSEAEGREFMRDANVRGDGQVVYADFVESLFSLAPELYKIKADFLYENPDEDPSVPPLPVIEEEEPPPRPPTPPPPPPLKKEKGGKEKGGKKKK